MSFASILQGLRKESKVTQEELAHHLGVSAQAVSKWENGSFPEEDLIPKIADYFHVSIDYLYGRDSRDEGIEQRVVNELNGIWESCRRENKSLSDANRSYMEKIHDILWAFHVGAWVDEKYYTRPEATNDKSRMVSVVLNDYGYSFMGLNNDRDFYLYLKQPKDDARFGKYISESNDIRALFDFLSDQTNLDILAYLYNLAEGEYVKRTTLIRLFKASQDKIDSALDYLCSIENHGNPPIKQITVVGEDGSPEKAYSTDMNVGGLFVGLLMVADAYVHSPSGYFIQCNNRTRQWFNKT